MFNSLALFDMNQAAHYFQWGPISISLGNLVVILFMILIFVLALLLPFPKGKDKS